MLSNSIGATLTMWDAQAAALAERLPPGPLRHARPRRLRDAARARTRSTTSAATCSTCSTTSSVEQRHFAGLSLGGMTGDVARPSTRPSGVDRLVAALHLGAARARRRTGPSGPARARAGHARPSPRAAASAGSPTASAPRTTSSRCKRDDRRRSPTRATSSCCAIIETIDLIDELPRDHRADARASPGAQDPATPPEHAELIVAGIPGARLEILDPAAHLAPIERPRAVTRLILEHLLMEQLRRGPDGPPRGARRRARRPRLDNATDLTQPFQEFITRTAWGEAWTRAGLDRKTRSCITLAILTALRAENEIPMHVRAAIRNGLTPEEILEVLIHTAVYAGVPAANSAWRSAKETLDAMTLSAASTSSSRSSAGSPSSAPSGAEDPELTLSRRRAPHRPHPRGRPALPAHARRPRLRAQRRQAVRAHPARARARLRVPVQPLAARDRRAAPRAPGGRGARVEQRLGARRRRHRLRRPRPHLPHHARRDQRRHALPRARDVDGPRAAGRAPSRRARRLSAAAPSCAGSRRARSPTAEALAARAGAHPRPGLGARRPGARGGPALDRRAGPRPHGPRRGRRQRLRARDRASSKQYARRLLPPLLATAAASKPTSADL